MSLSLSRPTQPRSLGTTLSKVFIGVGLAFPLLTGVLAVVYSQIGLINRVEVYPWDQILSDLFFLAVFITPESICVYLFQSQRIKRFLTRLTFVVIVVFLYANYIFLVPPSAYTFLPAAAGTLLWALWPPVATLAAGTVVGKVESKQVFGSETLFSRHRHD